MTTAITLPAPQIVDFCRRWKIERMEVFGSVLRDDFGANSDVDFLVTFAPETRLTYFLLADAEEELSGIIGHRAEIVIRQGVEESENWIRREAILSTAEQIYAA